VPFRVILNRESARNRLGRENEKTAALLRAAGAVVRMGRPGVADHSKFWVIDHRTLVVCSHNLSTRSVTSNSELGVVVWSELAARDAAVYFEKLWIRG
jgi:phosphatidylserine/phosphatidylglycerophosphate/cardiolipin synthase-like enzyme